MGDVSQDFRQKLDRLDPSFRIGPCTAGQKRRLCVFAKLELVIGHVTRIAEQDEWGMSNYSAR